MEIPQEKQDQLLQAVLSLNPDAREPAQVILGDANRVARLDDVRYFHDDMLRERYPQLRTWGELDQETQRGIASAMADSRDWQFSDLYQVDYEELYGLIIQSYPDAVGPTNRA